VREFNFRFVPMPSLLSLRQPLCRCGSRIETDFGKQTGSHRFSETARNAEVLGASGKIQDHASNFLGIGASPHRWPAVLRATTNTLGQVGRTLPGMTRR
jgi:hypothetical protein